MIKLQDLKQYHIKQTETRLFKKMRKHELKEINRSILISKQDAAVIEKEMTGKYHKRKLFKAFKSSKHLLIGHAKQKL